MGGVSCAVLSADSEILFFPGIIVFLPIGFFVVPRGGNVDFVGIIPGLIGFLGADTGFFVADFFEAAGFAGATVRAIGFFDDGTENVVTLLR